MSKSEKDIELFRRHMFSLLSEEERQMFDERLASDAEFEQAYNEYKALSEVLFVEESKQLKSHLQEYAASTRKSLFGWLRIAAAVVVLFGVFAVYQWAPANEPYEEYFDPYPNVIAPVTRGNLNSETTLQRAFERYEQEDYALAGELFEQCMKENRSDSIHFYWAMSLMNAEEEGRAEEALRALLESSPQNNFLGESQWYYGLLRLRNKDMQGAKTAFQAVLDAPGSFKKKEARELLDQLP